MTAIRVTAGNGGGVVGENPSMTQSPIVPRRRCRWPWAIVALLLAAALGAGAAVFLDRPNAPIPATGTTFTINGGITVNGGHGGTQQDADGSCVGTGGYSDMNAGTAVTVQDSHGATIATGALSAGTFADPNANSNCVFPFTVSGVPDGLSQYGVTVAHRGTEIITSGAAHNDVELTLGD